MAAMDVRWHDPEVGDPLAAHVGGAVRTGRLCPRCGSTGHGRPWATRNGRTVHVSLSRSGPYVVTVAADAPVGVDVESVAEVAARWQPDLVLADGESGDPPRTWAAKEAVLKLLGTGLDTPMTEVRLVDWELVDLDAPAGYVAVVATGRAAPSRAARRRTGR